MPSVFTIIIGIMVLIIAISWIPGVVPKQAIIQNGKTYYPRKLGILDALHAFLQGIKSRGDIIAFILAIGAYIYLVIKSKALEAGIIGMLKKLKGKEIWIIPVCITFFGLGGTIYNMCEETVAYYPILTPILFYVGFDPLVAIMTITFGAGMGVLGSTIAPFSVIIGSHVVGVNPLKGIIFRILIFFAAMGCTIVITMLYARRVQRYPEKSIIYHLKLKHQMAFGDFQEVSFTKKRKAIFIVFILTFVIMTLLELPWNVFFHISNDAWYGHGGQNGLISYFLAHHFPYVFTSIFSSQDGGLFIDLATLFFVMSLIVGFLSWEGEKKHIHKTVTGAGQLLGVALVVAASGGVSILLDGNHTALGFTISNAISGQIGGMDKVAFAVTTFMIFLPIAFLIPSTSGFAITVLPLFKSAAMKSHCESGLVTSFVCAEGFINLFTPAGIPMVCVSIAKIKYSEFIKGVWPLILSAFATALVLITIGAAVTIHQASSFVF